MLNVLSPSHELCPMCHAKFGPFHGAPSPAPSLAVEIAPFASSEQRHVPSAEGRSEMWSLRGYCAACAFSVANMFFQSLLTRMLLCVSWSWQKRAWMGGTIKQKSGHPTRHSEPARSGVSCTAVRHGHRGRSQNPCP